ncbi:MAG: glucose-1-phosphate cytidylyltransferase [Deltaproteobacteria bacterium]|nr:glucose-1-phosphate cytidylyltransferase [Deltaproteobacteria bacterium]
MQTVILCGGLGTRMREETEFRPKPMVPVGSRPIIWHIMKIFAHHGHTDFVLPLGYKGDMIREYFWNYEIMNNDVTLYLGRSNGLQVHNRHQEDNWKVTLVNTGQANLKGSRLKQVERFIEDERFMVTYGDGLANVNLPELLEFHQSHGKTATLTGVNLASRFGELKEKNNQVTAFMEKPQEVAENLINGGFFVFERRIFELLSPDPACDLEIGPLEELARQGELMVYKHGGFWACMDNIRDVDYLNKLWDEGRAGWKVW